MFLDTLIVLAVIFFSMVYTGSESKNAKNILTIVAVGDKYISKVKQYLPKYLQNGWDVRVLTNEPNSFTNVKTYKYPKLTF
jgi:hypothetical protein